MGDDFTDDQQHTLTTIIIFGAAMSLAGSLFIMSAFISIPKLHNFAFRLVFFMALCDFFHAFGSVFGGIFADGDHPAACRFQAFMIQFGSLASILWVTVISYCIKEVVINRNAYVEENMQSYHLFVWITSVILSSLPFTTGSYGPASGWCWIEKEDVGVMWRFVVFYIPLWFAGLWILWIYYRTIRQLENSMQTVLNRMKFYPLVLLITYFFATVNRVSQIFSDPIFLLACLHYFFSTLSGLFNCFVYGWTPTVRAELTKCCRNDNVQQRLIDFDAQEQSNYEPPVAVSHVVSSLDDVTKDVDPERTLTA